MASRQLDLDALPPGTYANTGELAQNGLKLNRFCYDLRRPENRAAYKADPDGQMALYAVEAADDPAHAQPPFGGGRAALNIS